MPRCGVNEIKALLDCGELCDTDREDYEDPPCAREPYECPFANEIRDLIKRQEQRRYLEPVEDDGDPGEYVEWRDFDPDA